MDKFLPCLAIYIAKLVSTTIKLSGMGMASSLPGKIALIICPSVLPYLANQLPEACLAVTGTNGKSTTSGLLASILTEAGYQVIHNRQGANLIAGLTATFIDAARLDGSLKGNFALLEVDEAALPVLTKQINCRSILVTNLFRDQLDRFGELDKTAKLIDQGIREKNSIAILNADDANVCSLPSATTKIFYGLNYNENILKEKIEEASIACHDSSPLDNCANAEISYCPQCGSEIRYTIDVEQNSIWQCPNCQYRRPPLNFYASDIKLLPEGAQFNVSNSKQSVTVNSSLPGLFNIYNATAAGAAATHLGIDLPIIKIGLEKYQTLFGRSEKLKINNRMVVIQLIKNPAGASKSLATLAQSQCAYVILAINDNLADGRDISWLWDANFEVLASLDSSFVTSGSRAHDMAVRLKYAGVDTNKITCIPSLPQAMKRTLEESPVNSTIWIIPTYTALLEMQMILKKYK